MSRIDEAIAFLQDHDQWPQADAIRLLYEAIEALHSATEGVLSKTPKEIVTRVQGLVDLIDGATMPLPPAASDPMPLRPVTKVTDHRKKKKSKRPKLTVLKGGKE